MATFSSPTSRQACVSAPCPSLPSSKTYEKACDWAEASFRRFVRRESKHLPSHARPRRTSTSSWCIVSSSTTRRRWSLIWSASNVEVP